MKVKKSRKVKNNGEIEVVEVEGGGYESAVRNGGRVGGYQVKEVDLSQVPNHLFSSLVKASGGGGGLSLEDINQKVEGWIIQCPTSVTLGGILGGGQKIRMDGSPTILFPSEVINRDGEDPTGAYEAVAVKKNEEESVFLVLNDENGGFKMASVPLGGYINVRKHIEQVEPPDVPIPRKKRRKLPSGIKERHSVYGIDFSEALSKVKVTKTRRCPSKWKEDYEDDIKTNVFDVTEEPDVCPPRKKKKSRMRN